MAQNLPSLESLTPRQIVAELDKYIVGQDSAKRAVAVALRNRYRREQLPDEMRDDIIPKNILMIGPTGVGKTEIARRLAGLARAPMLKVEATKFTEVGYVGRDVDSMIRDLTEVGIAMVEKEKLEAVQESAAKRAVQRILDLLSGGSQQPEPQEPQQYVPTFFNGVIVDESTSTPQGSTVHEEQRQQSARLRERMKEKLERGELEDAEIEVEVEERAQGGQARVFGPVGMEEMGFDMQGMLGNLFPKEHKNRKMKVREARKVLQNEEAEKMLDRDALIAEAIKRVEQSGILFIDELDKVAGREGAHGPEVSREGVQRDILPIVEGSAVMTKYGHVHTNHILFIAAGAFHVSKPSDLIPELQGRFPIRVNLEALSENDFRRILTEPRNALLHQYVALLAADGVELQFPEDGIAEIARLAALVNEQTENIGARRLHTVVEKLLDEISFAAPEVDEDTVVVDAAYVREHIESLVKNEDLSRYIL
jgi:ATP-dependent HslUV protease ATP-binding subunit HslU